MDSTLLDLLPDNFSKSPIGYSDFDELILPNAAEPSTSGSEMMDPLELS